MDAVLVRFAFRLAFGCAFGFASGSASYTVVSSGVLLINVFIHSLVRVVL